jgi:ferrous iron transport protein B
MTVSLIFGFVAKEIVIASLGTLYGVGEDAGALEGALLADPALGSITALAFMVFVLLYLPCIATMAVIRKETGSWKWTAFSIVFGTAVAYLAAFIIARGGALLFGGVIP